MTNSPQAQPAPAPGWAYLLAIFMPLIGIILAVVYLGQSRVGPGLAVGITSVVAWVCWMALMAG